MSDEIRFGTSGWRGIIADDFTFHMVRIVAQAISNYLKGRKEKPRVVVGHDTRFMAENFSKIVVEVLLGNDIEVYLCEKPSPTPVISHFIISNDLDGGINLTASHNPPEYLGIKFSPENGAPAPPEVTKEIEKEIEKVLQENDVRMVEITEGIRKELFEMVNPFPSYVEYLRERIDFDEIKRSNLKVAVDLMYGTAIGILDVILKELTEKPHIFHGYRDPYFGGYRPEPDETRMRDLGAIVRKEGLDCGVAVDGDADRFGIVDDEGNFIAPNEFIGMVAHHLYSTKNLKGPSVRSIATSHLLDSVARNFGFDVLETPVGFKFIGEIFLRERIVVGGEESGGLTIQSHLPEKDGILADLLALEMISLSGEKLSEMRRKMEEKYGKFYNIRIDVELKSREDLERYMEKFKGLESAGEFAGLKIREKKEIDGIQYIFDEENTWLLIRPSGTEPVARIYIESSNETIFDNMLKEVKKFG